MENLAKITRIGIDVGSTTAKFVILNSNDEIIHSKYVRHNTKIHSTLEDLFSEALLKLGDAPIHVAITGSAGIGISEKLGIPFIQEVVASTNFIHRFHNDVKTLIDIGGEDSKMIFFHTTRPPDIRMNGNCAGGTGAFIDQMASLLNVPVSDMGKLAINAENKYPIASRCGVFAKTDVQNLVARKIPKEDIAASIFHAVAIQLLNTLSRGFDIEPKLMFCGGPFSFLPEFKQIFLADLKISEEQVINCQYPELVPAIGAALEANANFVTTISELKLKLSSVDSSIPHITNRLSPLFFSNEEFENWNKTRIRTQIEQIGLENYSGSELFLGIDSGSTTSKITILGENAELLFTYYANNKGNPIETVKDGLLLFKEALTISRKNLKINCGAVTGYGEDLLKAVLGLEFGIVETIAHFVAAQYIEPKVSFILDIGGQDMKAIFVSNGTVNRLSLNESCSSGCGSFIETFSNSLGHKVADFAQMACNAQAPCDLGTRCTVFMNSKVKQSLRENATIQDIAAGLSYSVIKNALYKVLKLKDTSELGSHIVVQGGAFKNPSVHRALEVLSGASVTCSNIPELMGAYGAALYARKHFQLSKNNNTQKKSTFIGFESIETITNIHSKQLTCKGCDNYCTISKFTFSNTQKYFSGNKCEKFFSNKGQEYEKGVSIFEFKNSLLFDRKMKPVQNKETSVKIGIPRVLNMYENFPFWNSLLVNCGFEVVLSSPSTMRLYEEGSGTVMSDSICFPAKIVHGHVVELAKQGVDRIFYPMVVYEQREYNEADNTYNCPIVTGYPDVIKSAINPLKKYNIPFDAPTINFADLKLLKKACFQYITSLNVSKKVFEKAFELAWKECLNVKNLLKQRGKEIIEDSRKANKLLIVLAGRPYHVDPLINHKTPEILQDLGVNVITEDAIPFEISDNLTELQILSQWAYTNRIYKAAQWVGNEEDNIQFVHLNSFGCGPDAIVMDETFEILKSKGKTYTLIRIDEITSTGSVRLRLRSLIESLKIKDMTTARVIKSRLNTPYFMPEDIHRQIIGPDFGYMYSRFIPAIFKIAGYNLIVLPEADKESVQYGLKYSNNEICYPATVVVGDIIKALKSGKYKSNEIAIAITQTGGQCRASTYLSLIKKAILDAGFTDIPIVSVNPDGERMNPQPGFKVNWSKILPTIFAAVLAADSLAKMYYSIIVREVNKGETKEVYEKLSCQIIERIEKKDVDGIFELLKLAVLKFNKIPVYESNYPKIGIVGEIYVKYNSFGHKFVVDWLIEQGIEVVVPPILDFFVQAFVNIDANKKANLTKGTWSDVFLWFIEQKANRYIKRMNLILNKFRYYTPVHPIRKMAKKAEQIVNLSNQYGEGWLIPAEIVMFADDNINNVISLQPFGCIANHVISKGVEKRIRDLFPAMNLLFLDFDDGTSDVNIINRLHFMVKNVKQQ